MRTTFTPTCRLMQKVIKLVQSITLDLHSLCSISQLLNVNMRTCSSRKISVNKLRSINFLKIESSILREQIVLLSDIKKKEPRTLYFPIKRSSSPIFIFISNFVSSYEIVIKTMNLIYSDLIDQSTNALINFVDTVNPWKNKGIVRFNFLNTMIFYLKQSSWE